MKKYSLYKELSPIKFTKWEGRVFFAQYERYIVFGAYDDEGNYKSFTRRLHKKHEGRLSPMNFTFQGIKYEVRWCADPEESRRVELIDD